MHVSLQTSQSARAASVAAVPGFASAGRRDRDEMEHLALVTVIEQAAPPARRRRPFDVAGHKARRHLPRQRRREARVAGVSPVRMPPVLEFQSQRDRRRRTGNERRMLGGQFRLDMIGFDRRSERQRHERQRQRKHRARRCGSQPVMQGRAQAAHRSCRAQSAIIPLAAIPGRAATRPVARYARRAASVGGYNASP
jgi:hypothetical protein